MPPSGYPAFAEHQVEVRYDFPDGEERRFQVPFSSPGLTVLELQATPDPLRESFADGHRWLFAPADADSVTVRCRYRIYGDDEPARPQPAELFPGAARIRILE